MSSSEVMTKDAGEWAGKSIGVRSWRKRRRVQAQDRQDELERANKQDEGLVRAESMDSR